MNPEFDNKWCEECKCITNHTTQQHLDAERETDNNVIPVNLPAGPEAPRLWCGCRPCLHDPQLMRGAAIGMYHCPECQEMVLAGFNHPLHRIDCFLYEDTGNIGP